MMSDLLKKENVAKDREIRQLRKEIQQYEQTILNLRNDTSHGKYTTDVSRKDAEVMAGMCCTGSECGEWEPVKDFTEMLRSETQHFQERIQQMESNLKSSGESVRALRKLNVSLTEEMHAMRRVCAALVEEGQAATVRAQFKDDIIREMRRQLKQAKAKLRETTGALGIQKDAVRGDGECPRGSSLSYDSVTIACVRAQPRRKRDEQVELVHHNIHESVACDNLLRGNLEQDGLISSNIIFGNQFCDNPTDEPSYSECGHKLDDSRDEELANTA